MKKLIFLAFVSILLISCGRTIQPNTNLEVPTNLIASCNYLQEVTVSWDYDNGTIEGFIIQRKIDDGAYSIIDTTGTDVYDYTDSELTACTTNSYRVAAICDECMGEWSDETSIYVKTGFQSLNFGTESTLEIITWNLEHFPYGDEDNPHPNISNTIDLISSCMFSIDADIYALQEIESNTYFEDIIETLNNNDPENTWDGYRASSASYYVNLAYIYKSNQLQINSIYEIYQDDWYAFPRDPLVMEFTFNENDLVMINNHLKAGGDNDDEARRLDACQKLELYISDNFPDDEVILLGDLNDDITELEESNVFWSFINEPLKYTFADMEIAEGSFVYWSYPGWPSHLDHILITDELFDEFDLEDSDVQTFRIDELLDSGWSEYDNNISDHRPVGLKLAFP